MKRLLQIVIYTYLLLPCYQEARAEMDFTGWNRYDEDERLEFQEEVWDEVDLGKMPPDYYLFLHPDARVSETQRRVLEAWAEEAER